MSLSSCVSGTVLNSVWGGWGEGRGEERQTIELSSYRASCNIFVAMQLGHGLGEQGFRWPQRCRQEEDARYQHALSSFFAFAAEAIIARPGVGRIVDTITG